MFFGLFPSWSALMDPELEFRTSGLPLVDLRWAVATVAVYVAFVFVLKWFMKGRKITHPLFGKFIVFHNFLLSAGSLVMLMGMLFETMLKGYYYGVETMYCDSKGVLLKGMWTVHLSSEIVG